jgi:2-dehydropantoate 2-reductase
MKVCIFGAGAIGGHAAARMISTGVADVSIIARGPHLAAIQQQGILLRTEGAEIGGRPVAALDDPGRLPPQDLVIVALKAHAQPAAADSIARLLAPGGLTLFAMNGVPWWWKKGRADAGPLERIDPGGALWRTIGPERALGAVVNSSNYVVEPGIVVHAGAKRWTIGDPNWPDSPIAQKIVDLFNAAGMEGVLTPDIRRDVWRKLMTNISGSPIAALTRLAGKDTPAVAGLDLVAIKLIEETLLVAAAEGHDLRGEITPESIARPTRGRFSGKPSMLQDVEAGRMLEAEALMGQVQDFACAHGVPTPTIDTVFALLSGLNHSLWLAQQRAEN